MITSQRPSRLSTFRNFELMLQLLEDRTTPVVSGNVFLDVNANGVFDATGGAVDRGVAGVQVTAFDAGNAAIANTLSDALGNYVLNLPLDEPYRIEFTGLPSGLFFGPAGSSGNTAVQFVSSNDATGIDLAVVRPEDIRAGETQLATSVYVVGGITPQDLNYGRPVIVSFPTDAGAPDSDPTRADHENPTVHALSIPQQDVGATWGLSYDAATGQLYAASFMKRTTGFGPYGPGAIYQMAPTGSSASLFADLNSIFSDNPAGNLNSLATDSNGNPLTFRTNVADPTYWFRDGLVRFTDSDGSVRDLGWDAVGKIALGGLANSGDGSRLYTVALGDRRLYSLPTSGDLNAGTVQRFELPVPVDVTGITATNPLGDLRPFAVEYYRGLVYVGAVNSAESTQNAADLKAYVFAFDPATGAFINSSRASTTNEPVFEFELNYPRGYVHIGHDTDPNSPSGETAPDPAAWNPWSPVYRQSQDPRISQGRSTFPQPMLTGLSFDSDGNLILGLRDRAGDQFGRNLPSDPNNPNDFSMFVMTAGDTLQAFINAPGNLDAAQANSAAPLAGWTLESNGRGPGGKGTSPQSTGQGPGGGEFFFDDDFPHDPSVQPVGFTGPENEEVSTGGVLQLPGTTQTLSTVFNPVRQPGAINAGGVRWYDSVSGTMNRSYELYVTPTASSTTTFAKGNGVGDLIAIEATAPIEIGNYVWLDEDSNGIQDAGETGVAEVTLNLYSAGPDGNFGTNDDVLLATAVTDANGEYFFSSRAATSTTSRIFNLALMPDTDYQIRVPDQAALASLSFTTPFADASANGTARDSNADVGGTMAVHTPALGVADHTYDVGLVTGGIIVPPPPPPPIVLPAAVSGFVFRDNCPVNGLLEPTANGERGLAGVQITLTGLTAVGTVTLTTTTDANGAYSFNNLSPGDYTITETQPLNFYDGLDTIGSLSGNSPANDTLTVTLAANDAGTDYNFAEIAPVSVFGYVYNDLNQSHSRDTGDTGIPNVRIAISGTAFGGTAMARPLVAADVLGGLSTLTDVNGRWEFPSLPPGIYSVTEAQPSGYIDFFESVQEPSASSFPVTVGNDIFTNLGLCSGETRGQFDFGEFLPVPLPIGSKVDLLGSATSTGLPPSSSPPISTVPDNVPLDPAFTVTAGVTGGAKLVVTAAGAGRSPLVRVFDYATATERLRFYAYEETFNGGVRAAVGDVNGDGVPDIVTATGPGGGPRVRVFDGVDGSILRDFFAYESNFRGGVFVAVGDVNGDGKADIITGTEQGGGPRVTVFDAVTNDRIRDFFAFDPNQRGGVRVAAADFNGDHKTDIVATAGRGTQTRVRVYDGSNLQILSDFTPYDSKFTGGVFIAAGDVTGDHIPDVITAADVGGGPHVQVFDGLTAKSVFSFFADDPGYRGGIRISLQDVDGDGTDEIVTGTGLNAPSHIRIWNFGSTTPIEDFYAFDPSYLGGVYVG